jgi:hypothetical protein
MDSTPQMKLECLTGYGPGAASARSALKEPLEHHPELEPGELVAKAEMGSEAES